MNSRPYGTTEISVLGIGLCGLRTLTGKYDRVKALNALELALSKGINYVDLGFVSMCPDKELLKEYGRLLCRTDVSVAVKANVLRLTDGNELEKVFQDSLDTYGMDNPVFLQLYGVNRTSWNRINNNGVLQKAIELKTKQRVKALTLHYTDDRFYLKPVLEEQIFDGLSIEMSAIELPRNSGSLTIAKKNGVQSVITGALKNGRILTKLSLKDAICAELFSPGVACLLLEMLSEEEVTAAVKVVEEACETKDYVAAQLAAKKARDAFYEERGMQCEVCRSCMPCPYGFNAPRIAELMNETMMFGDSILSATQYEIENLGSRSCQGCGKCQKKCPREFPIGQIATDAAALFEIELQEVKE